MDETGRSAQRLAEALLAHRPRETSGSTAANRFSFQQTWALCHWLKLHESGRDYVLVMEYHDDVIVLDDDGDPQSVEFFQVKTKKDGSWSVRKLLSVAAKAAKARPAELFAASGQPPTSPQTDPTSILGKLFEHCTHFLPYLRSLNLVSNMTFKIPLANEPLSTQRERFSMTDVTAGVRSEFARKAKAELPSVTLPPWDKVKFIVTGLSLTDHETHGAGELAAYLERRTPGGRFPVQPLFRTLCGELSRRATREWQPVSLEELCCDKGVSRKDLEDFLAIAGAQMEPEEQLKIVRQQLSNEGMSFRNLLGLEAAWRRYCVQKMDHSNLAVQSLRKNVVAVVDDVAASGTWTSLSDFLELARREFASRHGQPDYPLDDNYLTGAILYEFELYRSRGLSTTRSQPEAETS